MRKKWYPKIGKKCLFRKEKDEGWLVGRFGSSFEDVFYPIECDIYFRYVAPYKKRYISSVIDIKNSLDGKRTTIENHRNMNGWYRNLKLIK